MYHEEKIISGILCWRNSPDAAWRKYSSEDLTRKIEEKEARDEVMLECVEAAEDWKKGHGFNPTGRLIEAIQAWEDIGG